MKVALIGATGRTGRPLIDKLLARGDKISALVRSPEKLGERVDSIRVIKGTISDKSSVSECIKGADVVISTLAPEGKGSKTMSQAARAILDAMKDHRVKRLIWMTGAGVKDPRDKFSLSRPVIRLIMKVVAADVLRDSEEAKSGYGPPHPHSLCKLKWKQLGNMVEISVFVK